MFNFQPLDKFLVRAVIVISKPLMMNKKGRATMTLPVIEIDLIGYFLQDNIVIFL